MNREQVLSPRVLETGDKIEVLLEGRTREFFFKAVPKAAEERKEAKRSIGSPLVASSIANRRSDGADGRSAEASQVMEADQAQVMEADQAEVMEEAEHVDNDVQSSVPPANEQTDLHPSAVSAVVSQMVQEMLDRVIKSVDTAACLLTPVNSSIKKKSVRFVANTPEGEARDTTMTIRCVPKQEGQHQTVLVEDNTMAISEWGFKTMKNEEDDNDGASIIKSMTMGDRNGQTPVNEGTKAEEDQNDVIERDVNCADEDNQRPQQLTPASIGDRVPVMDPSKHWSSPNMSNRLNFEALATGAMSQGTPGIARAPATTPVTAAKPFIAAQNKGEEVDFFALTKKLEEIAEEHDVQFELPKDFMRFTPVPSVNKSKRKSLGDAMSCHSIGRSSKRLSICSTSKEGSIEYDLPKDFMRFTPMNLKSALKNIEQTMTVVGGIHEALDDGAEEIATLRSVGHAVHDLADVLDKAASAKRPDRVKTPGVKITIVEKGSTFKTANPEVKVLFDTEHAAVKDDKQEELPAVVSIDAATDCQMKQAQGTVVDKETQGPNEQPAQLKAQDKNADAAAMEMDTSLAKKDLAASFKTALGQARAFKSQAVVLGKHLKKSSAKLSKARAMSKVLSIKYRAERAKRIELQNMIKRLLEIMEDNQPDTEEENDDVDMPGTEEPKIEPQRRVVVLGGEKPPVATNVEMAGVVAVVRPFAATKKVATPVRNRAARRSSVATGKSVGKSVKRVSVGGERVRVLVDDVEVPQWIFDKEADHDLPEDVEALDGVEGDADAQDEQSALNNLAEVLKSPLLEGPTHEVEGKQEIDTGEKDEETDADACFVCGVGDDGDILLLCDSCDNACHLGCCKPARKTVPKGDWFCAECKAKSRKRKAASTTTKAASKENIASTKASTKKAKAATANESTTAPTRATRRSTRT